MPVQHTPKGSGPSTNRGPTNGLASLMSSYGDSSGSSSDDETDSSDSEPETTGMNPTAAPKSDVSSNSAQVVLAPEKVLALKTTQIENTDDSMILGATITQTDPLSFKDTNEASLEDQENEVEVIGMFHNPESESFKEVRVKEEPKSDESSSDTEDSESDSDDSVDQAIFHDATSTVESEEGSTTKTRQAPRVKGEKGIYDLPLIEDLHISVPHEQCQPIGVIKSVVEPLVIVEALPLTPALDIDSVLFLDEGDRALGHVFDVFGQVKQPHYCVRFNSKDHIESRGIEPGMKVYCAPRTQHTSYVLIAQLKQMKGTDASWKHDIEPPPGQEEFSDDEMERITKRGGKRRVQKINRFQQSTDAGDVIPCGPPGPRLQGWKRPYGQQSPYIPAHVSGFGPPSRGYGNGNGFRGRGGFGPFGRGGQGPWGDWSGPPQQHFGFGQFQRYPPPQPHPPPYHQHPQHFQSMPQQQPYGQQHFQPQQQPHFQPQQQPPFQPQRLPNFQQQLQPRLYTQAPPPPPSPIPNSASALPNPFLPQAGSHSPVILPAPRGPVPRQPRFQNGSWSWSSPQ